MKKILAILFSVFLAVSFSVLSVSAFDYDSLDKSAYPFTECTHYIMFSSTLLSLPDGVKLYVGEDGAGNQMIFVRTSDSFSSRRFGCSYSTFEWNEYAPITVTDNMGLGLTSDFITDLDIYADSTCSGDLFFQAPPAPTSGLGEVVEDLTANQGMALLQKVSGVLKILVPFGVGCLALLTALPVLRKVLGRFLPV